MQFKLFFRILAVTLSIVTYQTSFAETTDQSAAFTKAADGYFNFYFPNYPSMATELGIHAWDEKLEDYSKNTIEYQINTLHRFEAEIDAISPETLDEQTQGDRALVLNDIRSKLLTLETIRPWEKNPDTYSSGITNSAFLIIKRNFAPVNDRLRVLIAREKLMPIVLQEARENLKNPPYIFTEIALEQLPDVISFFTNDVPAAFSDATDPDLKKQFNDSNASVIRALQDYQQWLKKDVLPHSYGDFRIGKTAFIQKLKYDEMVDTPLDKLLAINEKDMRKNQRDYIRIAHEIDPSKNPRQILVDLNYPVPGQVLSAYKAKFNNLIRFIKDKKIITIPSDVQPIMEETPPFERAIVTASMETPGPFEPTAVEAYFNVTLPDATWNKQKIMEYMPNFSDPALNNTSIHEAYPGHYVQFLWLHQVHDRIRQILGALTNDEGWAHYCEQMILDEGFATPEYGISEQEAKLMRLRQLSAALWRNARFVVGIKMHTGQMTFQQAVDFFVNEGYQSRVIGIMEAKRAASDPTYLYYTLGKLEILKLRKDLEKKEGAAFNLQQFHDDFMKQGHPPIKIVRKALMHDDSKVL